MAKDISPARMEQVRELPGLLPSDFSRSGLSDESLLGEVQLRQYWRIASKYRRMIIGMMLLGLVLSVIFAFTRTPLFTAETQIRVGSYQPILAATKIEDILHERSMEANYFETQIQEIKSRSLADRVLEDPAIRAVYANDTRNLELSGFNLNKRNHKKSAEADSAGSGYRTPLEVLQAYSDSVDIQPIRRTSLVNIRVTLPDAKMAALVADRHAQSYIEWVRGVRVEQQSRGLKFLQEQALEQRDRVAELERELAEYAETHSIVALNKDENITAQKMAQLNELLTAAIAKRIEAENLYKKALEGGKDGGAGLDNASTQNMRSELSRLEAEYRQLSEKFTDSYPRMQQLKAQIGAVKDSIGGAKQEIIITFKARAEAALMEEENLHEELEKQKSQTFELGRKQVQYNMLNRELGASRELLENIMRQIKETSVSVEGGASNISIVDYAVVPISPSYPRKKILILLGTMLGLAGGVGIALLLNYLDNTVRTPEDMQILLQLPTLGVVPSFGSDFQGEAPTTQTGEAVAASGAFAAGALLPGDGAASLPIVFHDSPTSLSSEAYRTIRTGLLLSQAGSPPRTMLFTSAQSSEGKTTSVLNIAASLASSGGNVVVVDADLRRPSIAKSLSLETLEGGLVELLTGQRKLEDVIHRSVVKGFTVLTAGKVPPNPAELLGSSEMAELIDNLAEEFDYVLIDSPPVLPVTDAMLLSRYVDGVVLVVKGKVTPRKVIKDARDRLASVGAHQLGVILNDIDISGGDYYYYNRYYYSYYQAEQA